MQKGSCLSYRAEPLKPLRNRGSGGMKGLKWQKYGLLSAESSNRKQDYNTQPVENLCFERLMENVHPAVFAAGRNPEE